MPLLNPNKNKSQSIKVNLNKSIIDEINAYVEHFGLADISDFLEQSAEYSLSKCAEWKKAKRLLNKKQEEPQT